MEVQCERERKRDTCEVMMDMERSAMASHPQTDEALFEGLKRHPILKARMMNLLALVENASIERADDAERQAIQELRSMGQESFYRPTLVRKSTHCDSRK